MSLAQNHNKITSLLLSVLFLNRKLHQRKHPLSRFFYIVDRQRNTTLALVRKLLSLRNCLREVSVLLQVRKVSTVCMVIKKTTTGINSQKKKSINSKKKIFLNSVTLQKRTQPMSRQPTPPCVHTCLRKLVTLRDFLLWVFHTERARISLLLPVSGTAGAHSTRDWAIWQEVQFHCLFLSPSSSMQHTWKNRRVATK